MTNNLNRKLYENLAKVLFMKPDNITIKEKTTMNEQDLLPMNTNQMIVFNHLLTESITKENHPSVNIYKLLDDYQNLPSHVVTAYVLLNYEDEYLILYNLGKHLLLFNKSKKVKDNE